MRATWIDYVTGEVTAFRQRQQVLDPAERIVVHLYANPAGEDDLRAVLADFATEAHGYVSPLVPRGELRASLDPIEDPRAVEISR